MWYLHKENVFKYKYKYNEYCISKWQEGKKEHPVGFKRCVCNEQGYILFLSFAVEVRK